MWFNFVLNKTVLKTRQPITINVILGTNKLEDFYGRRSRCFFLKFNCIVVCVANVSARVQTSVRFYSSVFESVFATVMSVVVYNSRHQSLGSYGSARPDAFYRRALKSRMSAMSICFCHTPKLKKKPLSLGHPKQKSLRRDIQHDLRQF